MHVLASLLLLAAPVGAATARGVTGQVAQPQVAAGQAATAQGTQAQPTQFEAPQAQAVPQTLGPYEPAHGCYIGAYIRLDPVVKGDIAAFEALVGKKHLSYFRYVGYGEPFPFAWVKRLKASGHVPHIAWEPNGGLDKVKNDGYLRGWAEAARQADVPIFLRFASEMNGDWQAWSGNPALYIEKWRFVYRVMHEVAPKVVMVWCPFATPEGTITSYYPGDQYVDWVGVNIYSVMRHDGDPKKIADEDPLKLLRFVYDLYSARKPIAICEYAATHYCQATGEHCTDFAIEKMRRLYTALPTEFPRVRMINWFSVDAARAGLAHNNYSLTTDPKVLAAYKQLIASSYFLSNIEGRPGGTTIAAAPKPATSVPLAGGQVLAGGVNSVYIAVLGAPPGAAKGQIEISVQLPESCQGGMVEVYLDGRVKGITNAPPYTFPVNAAYLKPGEHDIRVEVTDSSNTTLGKGEAAFVVVGPAS